MIKRIGFALAAALSLTSVAHAQELNPDTGMDTPGAWMPETGWTVTGSKGVGSSVISMKQLMQMNTSIKEGHRYKVTFDLSNYTSGELRVGVGVTMPSAVSGSWVTAASVSDVADNFTTANGLTTGPASASLTYPGDNGPVEGAFRFQCLVGKYGWVDPLVNPGTIAAHLHAFYGNSGVGKDWTFNDFRTKGSTTCGEAHTARGIKYPLNRSGYWMPAVFNGAGNVVRPDSITVYYKGSGSVSPQCALNSPTTDCRNIPTGLRMVTGYASNGTCGPTDSTCLSSANGHGTGAGGHNTSKLGGPNVQYDCWTAAGAQSAEYTTLAAMLAASQCTTLGNGDHIRINVTFPMCWDGVNVDSPNHRDHMSYTGNARTSNGGMCPDDYPVSIPSITVMAFFTPDAGYVAGKWHLSSDEMVNGITAGGTLHFDYWEAWSPTIRQKWYDNIIQAHNTSSNGDMGDGTALGNPVNWDGTEIGCINCAKPRADRFSSLTKYGMSKSYTANGTYTVELTAVGSGVWGFMGLNGFSGSIDNVHVVEISVSKGPVTVTGG